MTAKEFVENILKSVAEAEKIESFELIPDIDVLRGDGFLSEFYTGSIRNNNTGHLLRVYIKVPPKFQGSLNLNDLYSNECKFYLDIWPLLDKFQREKDVKEPFDKIPKIYCGAYESEQKYLALENLKDQNYSLYGKTAFVDQDHLRTLFETYGKFHALTFAFKEQNDETFKKVSGNLADIFIQFLPTEGFAVIIKKIFDVARDYIKKSDEVGAARVEKFKENFGNLISKALESQGEYSTLTHGDCWSNNMLFKYDSQGKLENLKLLDFQMIKCTTPVLDLSYLFYSGASKQDMDKLDEYLDIYYKSFSAFVLELGSDPGKLYPFEALKADWIKYSVIGMTLGLIVWQTKFLSRKEIADLSNNETDEGKMKDQFKQVHENEQFQINVSSIFVHAIERNLI